MLSLINFLHSTTENLNFVGNNIPQQLKQKQQQQLESCEKVHEGSGQIDVQQQK